MRANLFVALGIFKGITAYGSIIFIRNNCPSDIELYDNINTCKLCQGGTVIVQPQINQPIMIRNGSNEEATLFEATFTETTAFLDVSAIRPGSGTCTSRTGCAANTSKKGFNTPLQVIPLDVILDEHCQAITCTAPDCPDAYLFPTDDTKLRACKSSTDFLITFCPNDNTLDNLPPGFQKVESGEGIMVKKLFGAPDAKILKILSQISTADIQGASILHSECLHVEISSTILNSFSSLPPQQSTVQVHGFSQNPPGQVIRFSQTTPIKVTGAPKNTPAQVNGVPQNLNDVNFVDMKTLQTLSVISYTGANAGSEPDTYDRVTSLEGCKTEKVNYNSGIGPFSEGVVVVLRAPFKIKNFAAYEVDDSGAWAQTSFYDQSDCKSMNNVAFLNTKNINYLSGKKESTLGFATEDGIGKSSEPKCFTGEMTEFTDDGQCPDNVNHFYNELIIATEMNCTLAECKGYYGQFGHKGWGSDQKMFVITVAMPDGKCENRPALWMLNDQIVNAQQYGCNCRGRGGKGGCGELDIAEIIESDTTKHLLHSEYYFGNGDSDHGFQGYSTRPTDYVTFVVIMNATSSTIKIIQASPDQINPSASKVPNEIIEQLLKLEDKTMNP